MNRKRFIKLLLGITGAVSGYLIYRAFRRQKHKAVIDLRENGQIIQTASGQIEYAIQGDGATVLICHGGGGGYDQGLLLSWPESGCQFLAPSRPGYLRTPLETGETFKAQADAYAALLDALDIHKAAVLAASGGGPSALQFALNYPDRCWGVILLSSICQSIPAFPFLMQQITERIVPYFDFIPWLIFNTPILDVLIGSKTRSQIGNDFEKKTLLKELMRTLFPASLRVNGMLNDVRQIAKMPIYPLEKISIPALVIHGNTDSIVPFTQGEWSSNKIPNAKFLPIENGDHFSFITHKEIIDPAVIEFLKSHAP
jgi:pimeloyl-ACP methyl ester carboxylesterase